jgi:hypothetical protein
MIPQLYLIGWLAVLVFVGTAFFAGLEIREWIYALITWYSRKQIAESEDVS